MIVFTKACKYGYPEVTQNKIFGIQSKYTEMISSGNKEFQSQKGEEKTAVQVAVNFHLKVHMKVISKSY